MNGLFEQIKSIQDCERKAFGAGYKAGYEKKEQELKNERDKEIEAMFQDSLVDEEFARRAGLDAEIERQS